MATFAALLRAVNVGGTGKLPMSELRALCEACGFADVATYIQSGNVVFRTRLSAARAKQALESRLGQAMGAEHRVLVRTARELRALLDDNPFPDAPPARVLALFLDRAPSARELEVVVIPGREQLAVCGKELVIHFPDGMGKSKLRHPFQKTGTGRNLNTVRKLVEMLEAMD